jgi:hypothetical protein
MWRAKIAEDIPALLNLTQSVVYTYAKSWCDTQYIYTKHIKVEKNQFWPQITRTDGLHRPGTWILNTRNESSAQTKESVGVQSLQTPPCDTLMNTEMKISFDEI